MKRIILFTIALNVVSSADALITEKKAEESYVLNVSD